jgi:hypothetical protein
MSKRKIVVACLAVGVTALLVASYLRVSRTEFSLREVPADRAHANSMTIYFGCTEDRDKNVIRYPRFASEHPLYGYMPLPEAQGARRCFALDESKGTGTGYDRLYFDANANLDLTDDSPLAASGIGATVFFEDVAVPAQYDSPTGAKDYRVTPCLTAQRYIGFFPATVRQGRVRIGGRSYAVTLSRCGLSGRYDDECQITLKSSPRFMFGSLKGKLLNYVEAEEGSFVPGQMICHQNRWHRLAVTALGDRITVTPWTGKVGAFEVSSALGPSTAIANLSSSDTIIQTTAPDSVYDFRTQEAASVQVPEGDYKLDSILVEVGNYFVTLAANSANKSTYGYWKAPGPDYAVPIREHMPFTFALPGKAAFAFGTPDENARLRPGGQMTVRAFLTLPGTNLCVEALQDKTAFAKTGGTVFGGMFDMNVAVTGPSGNLLAQGAVPLRDMIYKGFMWEIPADYTRAPSEDKLTVTVTCDTGPLFGKLEASRTVIIESSGASR